MSIAKAICQKKMKTGNTGSTTISVNSSLNETDSSSISSSDSSESGCESVIAVEVSFLTPSTRISHHQKSFCTISSPTHHLDKSR